MKVKATHHVALYTPNFEEMQQFYGETLGFPIVGRWDEVNIVFFDAGGTKIELVGRDTATAGNDPSGGWAHLALHVDSVDETFAELVAKGVQIRSEPKDFQTVRIAFLLDPDGNALELVEDPPRNA
jgi:catechol 2,3-dioxygenase-like lactoylglutathione lyase family enzyme